MVRTCRCALLKRSAVVGSGGGALAAFAGLAFFCVPGKGLLSAEPPAAAAGLGAAGGGSSRMPGAGFGAMLVALDWLAGEVLGQAAEVPGSVCRRCRRASICAMASSRAAMLASTCCTCRQAGTDSLWCFHRRRRKRGASVRSGAELFPELFGCRDGEVINAGSRPN